MRVCNPGLFIRSIVDLRRTAAKQTFATFFDDKRYTRDHTTFANLVIDYLAQHGTIHAELSKASN